MRLTKPQKHYKEHIEKYLRISFSAFITKQNGLCFEYYFKARVLFYDTDAYIIAPNFISFASEYFYTYANTLDNKEVLKGRWKEYFNTISQIEKIICAFNN